MKRGRKSEPVQHRCPPHRHQIFLFLSWLNPRMWSLQIEQPDYIALSSGHTRVQLKSVSGRTEKRTNGKSEPAVGPSADTSLPLGSWPSNMARVATPPGHANKELKPINRQLRPKLPPKKCLLFHLSNHLLSLKANE